VTFVTAAQEQPAVLIGVRKDYEYMEYFLTTLNLAFEGQMRDRDNRLVRQMREARGIGATAVITEDTLSRDAAGVSFELSDMIQAAADRAIASANKILDTSETQE
jgi:hypothetical protein